MATPNRNRVHLEALEPRLLLSGDLLKLTGTEAIKDQLMGSGEVILESDETSGPVVDMALADPALPPLGSLIHTSSVTADFADVGEIDTYTLDLDPGQTLTLGIKPNNPSILAKIEVRDPGDVLLGSATASNPGEAVALQALAVSTAGRYTITFTSLDGTGGYDAAYWLNAILETENYGGPSNNSLDSAIEISPSSISMPRGADRLAVVGITDDGTYDYYYYGLGGGEVATIGLTLTDDSLSDEFLHLELLDSSGNLLTLGQDHWENMGRTIREFVASEDGVFYARVSGEAGREYTLVVTRGSDFKLEPTSSSAEIQDITLTGQVLGSLGGVGTGNMDNGSTGFTSIPINLYDGTGYLWDIMRDGGISDGIYDAYDGGMYHYDYNGDVYFPDFSSGATEQDGREIVLGPADMGNGILVTRKIYVPTDQGYARFLEIVTNTSTNTVNYTVPIYTNLGSDGNERFIMTSSGDTNVATNDNWVVTDDSPAGEPSGPPSNPTSDPVVTHVVAGNGGRVRPASFYKDYDNIVYTYNLTLAPGETQIVMHFASQASDQPTALDRAQKLTSLGLDALNGMSALERSRVVNFAVGDIEDQYQLMVNAGDELIITTTTPGDGPYEFINTLNPRVELYDPNGNLAGQDADSGPDGRNVLLNHTATMTGLYRVRVLAQAGSGEYVLLVEGATGAQQPFTVTGANPVNGSFLNAYPDTFRVDFSTPVLLTSVDADDLLINDLSPDSVTVIDADTLEFSITSTNSGDGLYTVTINAGALTNISGQPLSFFSSTFNYDTQPPVVTDSSLLANAVVAPGNLTVEVVFSEAMATNGLGAEDVTLVNNTTEQSFTVTDFTYDEGTRTATVSFTGLTEGFYTMSFLSNSGAFRDRSGNSLDGSPSFPLPSGDGVAGDPFVINFQVDANTLPFPVPLVYVDPEGSLIYKGSATGLFNAVSDTDSFTINLEAGQTLSLGLRVNSSSLVGRIELYSPDDVLLDSAESPSAGRIAALQTVPIADTGTYTIKLTNLAGSGTYGLSLYVNTVLGPPSATTGTPYTGPLTATSPFNFRFNNGANTVNSPVGDVQIFGVMVSPSGTGTTATATQGATVYNLNYRPSTVYPNQYVYTIPYAGTLNGQWSIEALRGAESVTVLTPSILNPQLIPLVENLQVTGSGPAPMVSWTLPDFTGFDVDVLRVLVYDDVTNTLIFRSSNLPTTATEYAIPEALLLPGGQYAFAVEIDDLEGGRTENRSRTYTQTPYITAWDIDPSAISLGDRADRLAVTGSLRGSEAIYSFSLEQGQSATLVLTSLGTGDFAMTLENSTGTVYAMGFEDATNANETIRQFVAPSAGTYFVRITGAENQGYSLVVTRSADFDLEPNGQPSQAQDISGIGKALGAIAGQVTGGGGGGRVAVVASGSGSYYDTGLQAIVNQLNDDTYFDFTATLIQPSEADTLAELLAYDAVVIGGTGNFNNQFSAIASSLRAYVEAGGGLIMTGWGIYASGSGTVRSDLDAVIPVNVGGGYTYYSSGTITPTGTHPIVEGVTSFSTSTYTEYPAGSPKIDTNAILLANVGSYAMAAAGEFGLGRSVYLGPIYAGYFGYDTSLLRTGAADRLLEQAVNWAIGSDSDHYVVNANVGDNLVITTSTPNGNAGEPVNNLDPMITLYSPSGVKIASDDNSGGDGRNGRIEYTVPTGAGGLYRIEVASVNRSSGDYILTITGATGGQTAPSVTLLSTSDTHVVINEGQTFNTKPTSLDVDFSEPLRLDSINAGDLLINGQPAVGVVQVDVNTLRFDITGLITNDGAYNVAIPAGSLLDLQGAPNTAFTRGIIYDATLPTVTNSSVTEGQFLTTGAQTFVFTFSEDLATSGLGAEDVLLMNAATGQSFTPASFLYDASTDQVTVQYANLPEGTYTLTLVSGSAAFRDVSGNPLNGDTSTPEADNFVLHFNVDAATVSLPAMTPMNPAGSLIYQAEALNSAFHATGDADRFTVTLEAGQTLTLWAVVTFGTPRMALECFGPDSASLGVTEAGSGGQAVLLQTLPVSTTGTYQVEVRSLEGIGQYTLKAFLNAAAEQEMVSGTANDTRATAQDIASSFINTGSDRGAVVGQRFAGTGTGSLAYFNGSYYELVSGTYLNWNQASAAAQARTYLGASGHLGAIETVEESIFINNTFGSGLNGAWLGGYQPTGSVEPGGGWMWVTGKPFTFTNWGSGEPNNEGGNENYLQFRSDSDAEGKLWNDLPGTNTIYTYLVEYEPSVADDWYSIQLTDGQIASFALTPEGSFSTSNLSLELYNAAGTLLTAGTDQAVNVDEVILDFVAPGSGDYYLRVSGGALGLYTLVVTRNQTFGIEPLRADIAQDISLTGKVLGAMSGGGRIAVVASSNSSYNSGFQAIVDQLNDRTYSNLTAVLVQPSDVDTLAELRAYDAVVIGGNGNDNNQFSAYASALYSYVLGGGGLVTTGFGIYAAGGLPSGTKTDFDVIVPVNVAGSYNLFYGNTVTPTGTHPIVNGVTSFTPANTYIEYPAGTPKVDSGATILAYVGSTPVAAAFTIGLGRSVYLGPIYAGSSGYTTTPLRGGAADRLLEQAVAWVATDVDDYLIQVNEGDALVITTRTPGDGEGEPKNPLDPKIELYDPSGTLVASDLDSDPDGRNVLLNYTALSTGAYKVRVLREEGSERGKYVLTVTGATGTTNAPPQVTATDPAEGKKISVPPASLMLDLSEGIRADSVQPEDLTIDGGASVTGVEIVDGDTVKFLLNVPKTEGTYTYTLGAGGITDLSGMGNLAYSGSFMIDLTPPRVVSQTPEVQSLSPFNTWSLVFSEPLNPATVQTSDFLLKNPSNGSINVNSVNVSSDGLTVTLTFGNQYTKGNYTLTVGTDIYDLAGNRMDQDLATEGNQTYAGTVQVAAPDLQPISISVTPTAGVPLGSAVSVSWTVRNIGNDDARANLWYDRIYISTNSNASVSGDTELTYFTVDVDPLAGSGGEYTMTQNVTLPLNDSFSDRTYYLKVWVDGYNYQPENNENNNILASAGFTTVIPPLPDLVVTNVTVPTVVEAGKTAHIEWTVANQGGAPTTSGGWYDNIRLSTDTTFGNGDDVNLYDYYWYSGNLAASGESGSSVNRSIDITIPTNRTGTWYVLIRTDHYNNIYERGNEGNNVGVSSTQMNVVVATEDLSPIAFTAPDTGVFGSTINLGWTVQNIGTGPTVTNWYDDVWLSRDTIPDNSDDVRLTYVYSSDVTPLGTGAQYSRSLENIDLPLTSSWDPGTYYLIFRTDAYGQEPEANENNNQMVRTINLTLPPIADLTVSNVIVSPDNIYAGDTIQVRWTLTNSGTAPASNFYDRLYLNNDTVLDGSYSHYLADFYFSDTINPGESTEIVKNVTIPVSLPGNWYVVVQSDIDNRVYEHKNENNNSAVSNLIRSTWGPLPDLVVSNIIAPQDIVLNPTDYTPVVMSWTITNQGNAPATNWYDYVWFSSDSYIGSDAWYGDFYFEGTINPGQSITRTQNINFRYDQAGNYWLVVKTDGSDRIYEVTPTDPRNHDVAELNNSSIDDRMLRVIFPPQPNLQVTSLTPPVAPFSGQETVVSWVVTNTGTGPTSVPRWYDQVYLSQDIIFDGTDTYLGMAENPSYLGTDPSNKSYTNSLTVTIPRGISGDYYFIVRTDVYNHVFENQNEGDNTGVSAKTGITLTPPPDLQVTDVNAPGGTSGEWMSITWTVANLGDGGTREGGWYDRIYMSTDDTLGSGDQELGAFWHSGNLPKDGSYTETRSVRLPIGIPADGISRDYYFFVVTDANNHVYEHSSIYEANNSNFDKGVVSLTPPPDLEPNPFTIPGTAQAGRVLTFNYGVTNWGSTPTPNSYWVDGFWLSTDATLDAGDIHMGDQGHWGALDVDQSYGATFSYTLPYGFTGSYYVIMQTDRYNNVFEGLDQPPSYLPEANNIRASANKVNVVSNPADLLVDAFTIDSTGEAGKQINVSWTVRNAGAGDTVVSNWSDQIIASLDGILGDADDFVLATVGHAGLLNPGGSYMVSSLLTLPFSMYGDYVLFLKTDVNNNVYESNDANNASAGRALTVSRETPDLQVISVTAPAEGTAGSALTVGWRVENLGTNTTNSNYWRDEVWLSTDQTLDGGDRHIGTYLRSNPLAPGSGYDASGTYTVPTDVAPGNYYVLVRTDRDNQVLETSESNNVRASENTVAIAGARVLAPDLIVESVDVPSESYSGQPFELTWTVRNAGADPTPNRNWYDAVYLSRDMNLDRSSDIYLGYRYHTEGLGAGEAYTATQGFTIPGGQTGLFYVFVVTDSGGHIPEANDSNNVGLDSEVMSVSLAPPANLVAGLITIPANGVPGQNASITYSVSNATGANSVRGGWKDSLYLSSDTTWDVNDAYFGSASIYYSSWSPLAGGESYSRTVTAPLPGLNPGNYYLIVRSDILNQVVETSEADNISASLVTMNIDAEELVLGGSDTFTLANDQSVYYRLQVGAGETVRVNLDSVGTNIANEIYIRFGSMPSRAQYDFASLESYTPDPEALIPETRAGTYYILVFGSSVSGAPQATISAQAIPFSITKVRANKVGNTGEATLEIRGAKFAEATDFFLRGPDNTLYKAQEVKYENASQVYATFNLFNAGPGVYDVMAVQANLSSTVLEDSVTVSEGKGADVYASIDGPRQVAVNRLNLFTLQYTNYGDADTMAPLLLMSSNTATPLGFSPGDMRNNPLQILGASLDGPMDVLRPGAKYSLQALFRSPSDNALLNISVSIIMADDGREISAEAWRNIEAAIRPAGMTNAQWDPWWARFKPSIGTTWGSYVQVLNRMMLNLSEDGHPIRDVRELFSRQLETNPDWLGSVALSGAVLNSADSTPMANVEVSVYRLDEWGHMVLGGVTTTDSSGFYSISGLQEGFYDVYLTGAQFDMDRDGVADNYTPNLTIIGTSNLTGQNFYAFTTAAVSDLTPQDLEPVLINDSAGVSHLIWDRGGVLYHAYYSGGQWIDGQPVSNHAVTHYTAAAAGNLLNGSDPGLIVVWNEGDGNSAEIWYAVGRAKTGGGYEWSEPVRVTNDTVADFGPEVAVTPAGEAIITYTKKDVKIQDDTDLYYSIVDIDSGALVFSMSQNELVSLLTSDSSDLELSDVSIAFSWSKEFDSGPILGFQAKAGIKVAGTIAQSGCEATAGLSGQGSLEVTIPDVGSVTGSISGALNGYWSVDYTKYPDCDWKFEKAQLDASGELQFKWENAIFTIAGAVPVLKPIAVAVKKAQDLINKYTPFTLEHGAYVGPLGFEAKNLQWTKIPPIPVYTGPDKVDSLAIYFKIGLYGTLKQKGVTTAELTISGLIGGKLNIIKKPEDPRLQFTYEAGVVAKVKGFEFFTFNISGAYPSDADMFALGSPLFIEDVTYNPAGSVGTGNDYGDSVLADISNDLWLDTPMILAKDNNGTVFGVWAKDTDPYGTAIGSKLYVADFNGTLWNAPVEVADSLGFNSDAVIGVDGNGDRLLVWSWANASSLDPDDPSTYTPEQLQAVLDSADLVFSVNNGTGWSAPQLLLSTTGLDSGVTMTRDGSGNLIIAWTYYTGENNGLLMSATWDGTTNSWSTPVQVISGVVASPEIGMVGGAPALFWNEDVGEIDGQFVLRYATLDAGVWSAAQLFAPIMMMGAETTSSSTGATAGSNAPLSPSGFPPFAIPDECCKCDPAKIKKITEAAPTCRPGGGTETEFDYKKCIEKTIVYEPCAVRPRDPNDILGPEGFGDEQWITASEVIPYMIRFENAADASAPAQEVVITQQLDSDLDFRTFRVDDFGWGDFRVALDANRPNYSQTLDFKDTLGFNVKVDININVATGLATWKLTTIDPATGEKPLDASIGFLPVNDSTGRGQGFVSYTVKAKTSTVTGDRIDAEARIIFDTEEPIDTPAIFNTLDAMRPESSVIVFDPAITKETRFLVSWAGTDDEGGSAIRDYTIYASEDGGPFSIWLLNTTLTESFFDGAAGHRYAFYSVARDNAGNEEAPPETADATIVVEGFGSLSGVVFEDMNGNAIYNTPADGGLGGWTVYLDINDNGVLDSEEVSVTSASDGTYVFDNLLPGVYTVRNIIPSGWVSTTGSRQANLSAGKPAVNVNLGNFELVGISGVKFHDLNNSGIRDEGEPGLSGWRIFLDADADGFLDESEQYIDTDESGAYILTGVGPGQVTIGEVMPGGWIRTTPAITAQLTSGTALTFNVGNLKLASISGVKFEDLDGDGVYDDGESGISGWTIFLDSNANGKLDDGERSTQTDANGYYVFTGLLPGSYTVAEVKQDGWIQTSPLGTNPDELATLSTSGSRLSMEIMGFG